MDGWLVMGILLLINKCHSCKILKEVLKIFQLLPTILKYAMLHQCVAT